MAKGLEMLLGVVNGAVGDYLHRTGNGLATPMCWARGELKGTRACVLVHGLMCTEDIWTMADGTDYGTRLERDFGYSPLYVRYNTGRPIADNGADLARLLEDLVQKHPELEEILLVGYSMGGLVIRSATHTVGSWLPLVRRAVYVATPHLGSPWERLGRGLTKILRAIPDPYTQLAGEIGDLRSGGIKDLGDPCHPYPLLPQIQHHLVAGSLTPVIGDGLVPVDSACADQVDRVKILPGIGHMAMAHHPSVYAQIKEWCAS
jgi:triacylglycerol lipase